jgi:uncharacterized protein
MGADVELVRRLFAAVERRDLAGVVECYHEEVEIHEAESLPYGGVHRGLDGAVRHAAQFVQTWAPYQTPAEHRLDATFAGAGGGTVVAVFRHRAVAPGGRLRLDEPEVAVYRVRAGKVVRSQMFHADPAALLRFLAEAGAG